MTDYPSWGSPERRAKDKRMIENADGWPLSTQLPVKNPTRYSSDKGRSLGVIQRGAPTQVEIRSMFASSAGVEIERFDSIDALLDAGWTVD